MLLNLENTTVTCTIEHSYYKNTRLKMLQKIQLIHKGSHLQVAVRSCYIFY